MIVKTKDSQLVIGDSERELYEKVVAEASLASEYDRLKAEWDARVEAAVKHLEPGYAQELARMREIKNELAIVTPEVDLMVAKTFADTGNKSFLGGLVKIQERKKLPSYNREPGDGSDEDKSVWAWIQKNQPMFFKPDWGLFEKYALAGNDPKCPIRPVLLPLPITRDTAKIAEQLIVAQTVEGEHAEPKTTPNAL